MWRKRVTWSICMSIHFWSIRISLRNLKVSFRTIYDLMIDKLIENPLLVQFESMKVDQKWNFEQFIDHVIMHCSKTHLWSTISSNWIKSGFSRVHLFRREIWLDQKWIGMYMLHVTHLLHIDPLLDQKLDSRVSLKSYYITKSCNII